MADIFATENVRKLFQNKFILLLGDSNMRSTYKDLVTLVNRNTLIDNNNLRMRGEPSFDGDRRVDFKGLIKGRGYIEGREFLKHNVHIEYRFITRCYTVDIIDILQRFKDGTSTAPDIFIMNSCIWDISRWGPNGVDCYKENMKKLMLLLEECLPKTTLFIWTTSLPISATIRGGVLVKQIDFLQNMLRFEIMEANLFCRHLVVSHGYDVLDTHYHLRMQIHRRSKDGIHYGPLPLRLVTNLLLTHISLSWNVPLPGNSSDTALRRIIENGVLKTSDGSESTKLPKVPKCLGGNDRTPNKKTNSLRGRGRGKRFKSNRGKNKSPTQWENRTSHTNVWETVKRTDHRNDNSTWYPKNALNVDVGANSSVEPWNSGGNSRIEQWNHDVSSNHETEPDYSEDNVELFRSSNSNSLLPLSTEFNVFPRNAYTDFSKVDRVENTNHFNSNWLHNNRYPRTNVHHNFERNENYRGGRGRPISWNKDRNGYNDPSQWSKDRNGYNNPSQWSKYRNEYSEFNRAAGGPVRQKYPSQRRPRPAPY